MKPDRLSVTFQIKITQVEPAQNCSAVENLFEEEGHRNGWCYPNADRLSQEGSLSAWVWKFHDVVRWDATITGGEPHDTVVGSVQLQDVAASITNNNNFEALPFWEKLAESCSTRLRQDILLEDLMVVERLIVKVSMRNAGLGRDLLLTALRYAWDNNRTPALVVQDTEKAAMKMYRDSGGILVTRGVGFAGQPISKFVFPDT